MIGELKNQINVHKTALDQRAESLMESHNNADKVIKNIANAEKDLIKYQDQSNQLDATLLKLMRSVKFSTDHHKEHATENHMVHLNVTTKSNMSEREINKSSVKFDAPFI